LIDNRGRTGRVREAARALFFLAAAAGRSFASETVRRGRDAKRRLGAWFRRTAVRIAAPLPAWRARGKNCAAAAAIRLKNWAGRAAARIHSWVSRAKACATAGGWRLKGWAGCVASRLRSWGDRARLGGRAAGARIKGWAGRMAGWARPWWERFRPEWRLGLLGAALGAAAVLGSAPGLFPREPWTPRRVALTFDDGPHPAYTSRILEILRAGQAKATFFVVGSQAALHPEALRMILLRADELGNHTFSHPNLTRVARADLLDELDKTRRIIKKAGARDPLLFRPPGGDFNGGVLSAAREAKYRVILWTVLPRDHESPPPTEIAGRVLAEVSDGGVILLHSGVENTVRALPRLLDELRARGFRCVTVGELLSDPRPTDPRAVWLDASRLPGRWAPPARTTSDGGEAP